MNNLQLNINNDNYTESDYFIIFQKFGNRPNKIITHYSYNGDLFEKFFIDSHIINRVTEYIPIENDSIANEKILLCISDDIYCSYVIIDKLSEDFTVNDLVFLYRSDDNLKDINIIINEVSKFIIDTDKERISHLNTITFFNNSIELDTINIDKIDLKNRYNENIIKKSERLCKKIKKSNKGLSIICGDKGVGKTTLVSSMCSEINRISIFIPNNMVDMTINNPEFKNFIQKHDKVLIVIDDCEFLTNSQFIKLNHFTNNIIQMVDGVLSDLLNLQIILIFNIDKDEIDENILDCNSLIDIIEIDNLTQETAMELSKELGRKNKYKEPVRLVDVIKNRKLNNIEKIGL